MEPKFTNKTVASPVQETLFWTAVDPFMVGIADAANSSGQASYGKWCQVLFRASTLGLVSAFAFGGSGAPTYGDLAAADLYSYGYNTLTAAERILYDRVSLPKALKQQIWENSKSADGNVYDPQTGRIMNFDEPWVAGHKYGFEFWKAQQSAALRGITREQFIWEQQNVNLYQAELQLSNSSHAGEAPADTYYGPNGPAVTIDWY